MAKSAKDYQPSFGAMIPARVMVDNRFSDVRHRALQVYAFHDRMSLTRGAGDGCTASNKRLLAIIGCDYTTLIKVRADLVSMGYLLLEPKSGGKRLEVARVIPDHLADPKSWPFDQRYIGYGALAMWGVAPEKVGDIAKHWAAKAGQFANDRGFKVGDAISETPANPPKTDPQYIPLSGERYFSEERKYNSPDGAHLSHPDRSDDERNGRAEPRPEQWQAALAHRTGKDTAEAGWAEGSEFASHLPANIDALSIGAQLSRYEKAFAALGRDPEWLTSNERQRLTLILADWVETFWGGDQDAIAQQAQRLLSEIEE